MWEVLVALLPVLLLSLSTVRVLVCLAWRMHHVFRDLLVIETSQTLNQIAQRLHRLIFGVGSRRELRDVAPNNLVHLEEFLLFKEESPFLECPGARRGR